MIVKNCPPRDTIRKIREILYKCGITVLEQSYIRDDFYNCHLYIANEHLFNHCISTNGKGMTAEYALASAYAEMMERLQCGHKFLGSRFAVKSKNGHFTELEGAFLKRLEDEDAFLDYEFFPDEMEISLLNLIEGRNPQVKVTIGEKQLKTIKNVYDKTLLKNVSFKIFPYYHLNSERQYYMNPVLLNTGSNGMCAGNNREEAISQGLCEILERYALKNIMLNSITPPQIPLEMFKGYEIYDRIESLKDFEVVILDCSMGWEIPIIGVIFINKESQKYGIKLGSSHSPIIALERCFTEFFQSIEVETSLFNLNNQESQDADTKQKNFYNQLICDGEFDISRLLTANPTYSFSVLSEIKGENFESICNRMLQIIIDKGYDIYIRDNSWLGFPTYHIFIPGMSDILNNYNDDDVLIKLLKLHFQRNAIRLPSLNQEDTKELVTFQQNVNSKIRSSYWSIFKNFLYNSKTDQEDQDSNLFAAVMSLHCKDYKNARKYLEDFLNDNLRELNANNPQLQYFKCSLKLVEALEKGFKPDELTALLSPDFETSLIEETLSDISAPNQYQYYELPDCFKCDSCQVFNHCHYIEAIKVVKSLQRHYVNISQDDLKTLNISTKHNEKNIKE